MGYLLAIVTIFIWSINIIIAKEFASTLPPFVIATGRWIIGAIILTAISRKELWDKRQDVYKHIRMIIALSFSGVILNNTLVYYAAESISPIQMGLLSINSPIFLIILSAIFLGVHIDIYQFLGILMAIIGVLTVITNGDLEQIQNYKFANGDYYMIFNSLLFCTYSILQKKRTDKLSQSAMLAATAIVGIVIMLPISMIIGKGYQINLQDLYLFIYLGIFNSAIAFWCWNTALQKIGSVKTGIIYYLMPIFAAIEAYIFFGEKIDNAEIVGGITIIFGILIISFSKIRRSKTRRV